ncbi:MAG: sulfite exporter TauE/SafE family protein [Spirochaetaceae bacterium]|nr:MAG: sulfite exporter TauE/SafE family protein [Spirochaetaceae bacterium]
MPVIPSIAFGAAMGLSLGLTGGGGSILAVPLLVYGLGLDLRVAVTVSLAVVGLTALFGALIQARSGQVLWRSGLVLGVGGILVAPAGAFLGTIVADDVVLILFALLMVVVGVRMARSRTEAPEIPIGRFACPIGEGGRPSPTLSCFAKLAGAGAVVGLLSGFFGVGGGFLLVPALIFVGSVRIEPALATSLVAIALISVSGFAANVGAVGEFPLLLAATFGAGGAGGMIVGAVVKRRLPSVVLNRVFAAVAIAAGIYVVAQVVIG